MVELAAGSEFSFHHERRPLREANAQHCGMESFPAEKAAGTVQIIIEREKDFPAEIEIARLGIRRSPAQSKDAQKIFGAKAAAGNGFSNSVPGLGRARLFSLAGFWAVDPQNKSIGRRAASGRGLFDGITG